MSTPCLPIHWPTVLEETGPVEDPTMILSATAHVGATPFRVVAIRVEPGLRFMPDYRPGVPDGVYDAEAFESLLGEVGEISGTDNPHTIELATGCYVMWMAPAPGPTENEAE